jgi:hypothetical protein
MPFLIEIVVVLIIVGLLLWVVTQIPGLDPAIVRIIRVVVIVAVVIWLLYAFVGMFGAGAFAVPRYR